MVEHREKRKLKNQHTVLCTEKKANMEGHRSRLQVTPRLECESLGCGRQGEGGGGVEEGKGGWGEGAQSGKWLRQQRGQSHFFL